jgi:hypothetical protein
MTSEMSSLRTHPGPTAALSITRCALFALPFWCPSDAAPAFHPRSGSWSVLGNRSPGSFDAERDGSRPSYPQSFCAGLGQVDHELPLHWTAIIDANDNTRAVRSIDDTHERPERECAMARRQSAWIGDLAVRGPAPQLIPSRNAALVCTRCCTASRRSDQRCLGFEVIELASRRITVQQLRAS